LRPYWLGPPPARPFGWRGFFGRSGAAATLGSGVSSAASSAVVGVRFGAPARDRLHVVSGFRIKRGHCGSSWLRRSGGVRLAMVDAPRASEAAKWRDDQPDASLEVLVPCSARLPRRVFAGRRHLSGHPASTVGLRRPPPSPLVIALARGRCTLRWFTRMPRARHRAPTQRLDAGCPCGFSLGGDDPVDFARIDAARFGWDAPPFSLCAAASHA
jgi:hypothetical protein